MSKWSWGSGTSVDELRSIESEMSSALSSMDYDSNEYLQLDLERINVVNEISSRSADSLPRREHGWYLSNDD